MIQSLWTPDLSPFDCCCQDGQLEEEEFKYELKMKISTDPTKMMLDLCGITAQREAIKLGNQKTIDDESYGSSKRQSHYVDPSGRVVKKLHLTPTKLADSSANEVIC
jgi:hypothetical protein